MGVLKPVAATHGASVAQVVIAWTIAQPGITFSLCGARDPAQAVENAAAARLRLTESELALISAGVAEHLVGLDT
ncbi:Aldo/keto reductase family protein [compost metagenome]